MSLYAAYGANLDPARMQERCPRSPAAGVGWLEGWRLTFGGQHADGSGALDSGWNGAMATVVEAPGERVFVTLYDVHELDERELDAWQGADRGLYRKVKARVATLEGDLLAWLYVLDAYEGGLPSARHLAQLAEAAEAAGAPDDYVSALRLRNCLNE
jgi:gamma-glutamylcyclotransferase (GGCT)/AIG2-like uncharacterized protein YtfP